MNTYIEALESRKLLSTASLVTDPRPPLRGLIIQVVKKKSPSPTVPAVTGDFSGNYNNFTFGQVGSLDILFLSQAGMKVTAYITTDTLTTFVRGTINKKGRITFGGKALDPDIGTIVSISGHAQLSLPTKSFLSGAFSQVIAGQSSHGTFVTTAS